MANFLRKQWKVHRRHVLKGLGASIALPWLSCMSGPNWTASSSSQIARSVFIYIPNGVNTLTWQIEQSGKDYLLPATLSSLEQHRTSITPISGLHHPHGIGHAHQCDKIWLTGASLESPNGEFTNTQSADQVMAARIGSATRFGSLELSITGGTLAHSEFGTPLPAERKPSAVFQRMFGQNPEGVDSAKQELRNQRSVLDLVIEDSKDFKRRIGQADRNKLDEYLDSVREVERRVKRAETWLNTPLPEVDEQTSKRFQRHVPQSEAGEYYRTMYDLMVLALQTDMTRVITCMSGSESLALALPEIGINQNRHELSHHNGIPQQMDKLTRCDTFLVNQFAYFLDRLSARDERGESLLDSTMVLFGSGMAYGHSHGNANLPTILAGGKSLGIRHGSHLDFNLEKIDNYDLADAKAHYNICMRPVDQTACLNNLLLTMIQRMGIDAQSFGDSNRALHELTE